MPTDLPTATPRGQLACVGLGMMLGAHLTPRSRGWLEAADRVFVAASDALVEQWVATINPRIVSLQGLYAEGKPRQQTYREMAEACSPTCVPDSAWSGRSTAIPACSRRCRMRRSPRPVRRASRR